MGPARLPPPDQSRIAKAPLEVEDVSCQAGLDKAYGRVAELVERDLAARFDLVTDDGAPDPRYCGRGEEFRLVSVQRHTPQQFGYGSVPWKTRGGALLLGLLEEWSGLLKRCAVQGASAGLRKEGARLRAALARPRLVVASHLTQNPDVNVTLTVVLEGPTNDPITVRSMVTSLMTVVGCP